MPSSRYCRFELRWERFLDPLPAGAPAELTGASVVLIGTRADGVQFAIRSEREDEFRLDAVDGAGFVIDAATSALFMALDQQLLLANIDLDAAVVGADGRILIDSTSNEDLADIFDGNLRAAARLFDDDDGDGELDVDERAPGETLAQ